MGLFTIEFELGRETRGMVERVVANLVAETCALAERVVTDAAVQVELGEKTREALVRLVPPDKAGRAAAGGIIDKARDEAKRITTG